MLTFILLAALLFAVGVVIGAYSHKWLAKVTGAPSNLSAANAPAAVAAVVAHGETEAAKAIQSVADAAVAKIKA